MNQLGQVFVVEAQDRWCGGAEPAVLAGGLARTLSSDRPDGYRRRHLQVQELAGDP